MAAFTIKDFYTNILLGLQLLTFCGNIAFAHYDFGKSCAAGKPGSEKDGEMTATRIKSNSKFIAISGTPKDASFEILSEVCKNWGLDMAQIKHPKDLKAISTYFHSINNSFINSLDDTTFWISGTDAGHQGRWTYSQEYSEKEEDFYFQAFYGFSPINLPTKKGHQNADNVQLHWTEDPFVSNNRVLVMMDVEESNQFYKRQSIICQYRGDSECFTKSDEEKLFQSDSKKKDKTDFLGELSPNKTVHVSFVQKTVQDAVSLCKAGGKELLNLGLESEAQANKLFALILSWIIKNELHPASTAFWVGSNDLFSPGDTKVEWDWVDNVIRDPSQDPVLMFSKTAVREGEIQGPPGQCLAIGVLFKEGNLFHLQRVPCELPQWVLCSGGKEASAPKASGRAIARAEGTIKLTVSKPSTTPRPITTTAKVNKSVQTTTTKKPGGVGRSITADKGKSTTTPTTTKSPGGWAEESTTKLDYDPWADATTEASTTSTAKPGKKPGTTPKSSTTPKPKGKEDGKKVTTTTKPKTTPKPSGRVVSKATTTTKKPDGKTTKPTTKKPTTKPTTKTTKKPDSKTSTTAKSTTPGPSTSTPVPSSTTTEVPPTTATPSTT